MPTRVSVNSVEGSKFEQVVQSGDHVLFADEPASAGGSSRGPSPYEYLLAALGNMNVDDTPHVCGSEKDRAKERHRQIAA